MPRFFAGICGYIGAISAPCFSLAAVAGTIHYNDTEALLTIAGTAAAQIVVAAPSGVRVYEQTPFPLCFLG